MTPASDDTLWQAKLHARVHDPAEKALVLFRDPAGHEGGTSRTLHSALFPGGVPAALRDHVKRADRWASAADRPQLPKHPSKARVEWSSRPILIHPLTGKEFDLRSLADTDIAATKARSLDHFRRLIVRADEADDAATDWRRTLLAYWRFGPELVVTDTVDDGKLGALWPHLPADTRIPDHTIWDHLDLTSAFAGAFAADENGDAALLALSIGPVQPFIAAARSTSDLWAGSHLLARLAWEAMRVVCERLGPDAVLFPRLRGIPQVDLWLRDDCGLERDWFSRCEWTESATDANPLFAAALPNRFVAVVPADGASEIAAAIERRLRDWLQALGRKVVARLMREAGEAHDETVPAYKQMRDQLHGFPEAHWSAVPFSLVPPRNPQRRTGLDTARLSEAMAPFFGAAPGASCGFLASPAWQVLRKELRGTDAAVFYAPNPGVLYPAVHDLAERVLAAAKAARPFTQTEQRGWRCSLTGETEWLTTDPAQLDRSYRRQDDTLWAKAAARKPAWARKGEHLGALPAIKRLWPTMFAEDVGEALGKRAGAERFVVSTHTMALAAQIDRWLDRAEIREIPRELREAVESRGPSPAALPRRLVREHSRKAAFETARRLPGLLEDARDADDESERGRVEGLVARTLELKRIETYYGLLLMDGDHMGRIVAGEHPKLAITYAESFHPDVRAHFREYARDQPDIGGYLDMKRAVSPNRHLAISATLNEFALRVVPAVVEGEYLGRVLYAGGDDVLAMLPAADLLSAMRRLRYAYSGSDPHDETRHWRDAKRSRDLFCKDGFAFLAPRLMRMMGDNATASCGAVVAHHQAPLSAVLRELRAAERRAKDAGRDRFDLTLIKRSGGELGLTARWDDLPLLLAVRDFLAEPAVSRRAVHHVLTWLRDLPDDAGADMLETMLAYQLDRQTADPAVERRHDLPGLARRLAERLGAAPAEGLTVPEPAGPATAGGSGGRRGVAGPRAAGRDHGGLDDLLAVAEFLAREARRPNGGTEDEAVREPAATREGA